MWAEHRLEIVTRGSVHKFGQDEALRAYLLGTGKRVLLEAGPLDRIWDVGLAADDPRAADPATWQGFDLLGAALMAARAGLAAG